MTTSLAHRPLKSKGHDNGQSKHRRRGVVCSRILCLRANSTADLRNSIGAMRGWVVGVVQPQDFGAFEHILGNGFEIGKEIVLPQNGEGHQLAPAMVVPPV